MQNFRWPRRLFYALAAVAALLAAPSVMAAEPGVASPEAKPLAPEPATVDEDGKAALDQCEAKVKILADAVLDRSKLLQQAAATPPEPQPPAPSNNAATPNEASGVGPADCSERMTELEKTFKEREAAITEELNAAKTELDDLKSRLAEAEKDLEVQQAVNRNRLRDLEKSQEETKQAEARAEKLKQRLTDLGFSENPEFRYAGDDPYRSVAVANELPTRPAAPGALQPNQCLDALQWLRGQTGSQRAIILKIWIWDAATNRWNICAPDRAERFRLTNPRGHEEAHLVYFR